MSVNEQKSKHWHASTAATVERVVTMLAGFWVSLLPWLIGGRLWWVQALGAGVGLLALAVAMLSRSNRSTLTRFPIFWLGFLFLGYIASQALNPWIAANPVQPGVQVWRLDTVAHVLWLPRGVKADFWEMNAWRDLINWAGPWLLACAWWSSVRRRRATWWLWGLTLLNGVLITVESVVNIYLPNNKILWFYVVPGFNDRDPHQWGGKYFHYMSGFLTNNPAAAYLCLALAAGLALALRVQARAREDGRDTGFGWVVLVGCIVVLAGIVISGSRGGLLIGAGIFAVGVLALLRTVWREGGFSLGRMLPTACLLVLLGGGGVCLFAIIKPAAVTRLRDTMPELETDTRRQLWQVTLTMIREQPWLGYGAGSYRYISPGFFFREKMFLDDKVLGGVGQRANYAHSDWLQFPMEYGLIGAGLLLGMLVYFLIKIMMLSHWLGAPAELALVGAAGTLVHALFDFPLHNVAVLSLWAVLLVSACKVGELNRLHGDAP
jgi:O-antigen ligase